MSGRLEEELRNLQDLVRRLVFSTETSSKQLLDMAHIITDHEKRVADLEKMVDTLNEREPADKAPVPS